MSEFTFEDLEGVISQAENSLVQMLAAQLRNQIKSNGEKTTKCAALAAELKQSKIDAGCYKKGMEASNERLVQVAAENAALKDFLHSRVDESICDKHIKTPATDAYRDELRAQGIEMAAKSDQFSMWVQQGLRSFAIGVRQGGERELSNLERNVLECAAVIAKDRERGGAE